MKHYIIRRIFHLILVLFGVSLMTFFLSYVASGDPAQILLNQMGIAPTQEVLEQAREKMGLNAPVPVQYIRWLGNVLQGNFGVSYKYNSPVIDVILLKLPATLKLMGASIFLVILIAFPLGILSAAYKNKAVDYIVRIFSVLGISMPTFWMALLFIYFFTHRLHLFPIISGGSFAGIIMPAVTLAFSMVGKYVRLLRTSILEEMRKDYVVGAYSRGISRSKVLLRHILPNVMVPVVTMLGLSIGGLMGGAAIVESVFVWPGVGEMAVDAISNRDYPLIQGYVLWMALIYVLINLVVDLICASLNYERRLQ